MLCGQPGGEGRETQNGREAIARSPAYTDSAAITCSGEKPGILVAWST